MTRTRYRIAMRNPIRARRNSLAPAGDTAVRTPSLRRRVVLSVLGLLIIVLTALGLIMNFVLGNQLRADLQQRLVDRTQLAQVLATENVPTQSLLDQLAGQGITAQLTSGQQTLTGRDNPTPPGKGGRNPPPAGSAVVVQRSGDQLTTQLTIRGGTLVLQASQAQVDQTLSTLRRIELAAGAVSVLLTALLLIRIVDTALTPLDRMTTLADHIRNGLRGRRLHPTHPRTELGRTAMALDGMLDALETAETHAHQAEDRMRAFLADASHDLRTPLAGVIGNAELLLRTNPDRAERETRLVDLIREAQRAARLVDDLLLITRLDTPHPTLRHEPVNLTNLAHQAITIAQLRRPDRTITLHPPTTSPNTPNPNPNTPNHDTAAADAVVTGDPDHLQRALANLLDNATTATPPGGHVTLTITATPTHTLVTITDNGPGLPPNDQHRIFDRFVRLNPSRSGTGSGLGLPIARAIATAHHGQLHHIPTPTGARFDLTLPTTPPGATRTPDDTESPGVTTTHRDTRISAPGTPAPGR